MKTTTIKVLLMICILLLLAIGVCVTVGLIKPYLVPKVEKFEKKEDNWVEGWTYCGDGTFGIRECYWPHALFFDCQKEDGVYGDILSGVDKYRFDNDNMYVSADDGMAVCYPESNICKVLITPVSDFYPSDSLDYEENEDGSYSRKQIEFDNNIQDKFIVYLDSFEEFTPYEQKMLNELVN